MPTSRSWSSRDGVSRGGGRACAARRRGAAGPIRGSSRRPIIPLEDNFTSNLRGGEAFVQIGIGVSTYYDERVIEHARAHEMAVRSADPDDACPSRIRSPSPRSQGKEALKEALKNAINDVLTNREGFGGIDEVYFTSFVTQ